MIVSFCCDDYALHVCKRHFISYSNRFFPFTLDVLTPLLVLI